MDGTASETLGREALIALFREFPDRFVLIGGSALRFLHGSPRRSADLDLLLREPLAPGELAGLALRLETSLAAAGALLGTEVRCRALAEENALEVEGWGRPQALIQFTLLGSAPKVEKRLLGGESLAYELVVAATSDGLLFSKLIALLKRARPKGRDVFDLWFLEEKGAKLDREAFADWLRWEGLDAQDLERRLAEFSPRLLAADLDRFLPSGLASRLKADGYQPLISAARRLLRPFLEEGR